MLNTMPALKILRKVQGLSPAALQYLGEEYHRRRQSIDPETNRLRADVVNPMTGWIDNDVPRDEAISHEIAEQTLGFAVAGHTGQIIKEFLGREGLALADKARRNATFNLSVGIDDEVVADGADEPNEGALPGSARRSRDQVPT